MQKMKSYAQRMCITVCVLSAFGFAARWVQNMSIYEEETGLAIEGAASSYFLVIFTLAALCGMLMMALPLRTFSAGSYPPGDVRGEDGIYRAAAAAGALALMAGGITIMLTAVTQLMRVLGILAGFSGLGTLYTSLHGKRGAGSALGCLATVVPVLFGCFWLIVSYKDHSSNPVVWSYAAEILAIASLTEALYLIAGFVFGRPRVGATAAFLAIAAYFCFMALGDERSVALQLCFGGLGLYFIATLYALICSLRPDRRRFSHLRPEDRPI